MTRPDGSRLYLNAEMIERVESTPDTIITLTGGDKLVVQESIDEVIRRCIAYGRACRSLSQS